MSLIDAKIRYDLNEIKNKSLNVLINKKAINIIKIFNAANPHTEWSGILFYKLIEDNLNFDIEVIDILLMDIGNSTTTSYEFNSDFVSFIEEQGYIEEYLTTIFIGHVHSHNQMGSFFSGTDINELVENSENHKLYLSLIVNNRLEMVAKAVIREEVKQKILSMGSLGYKTNFINNNYPEEEKIIYKLWAYTANITLDNTISQLDKYFNRLSTIIKEKQARKVEYINYKPSNKQSKLFESISEDKSLQIVNPKATSSVILKALIYCFDADAKSLSEAITNLLNSDYLNKDIDEIYQTNIAACLAEENVDLYADTRVRDQLITQISHSLAAYPDIKNRLIISTSNFGKNKKLKTRAKAQEVLSQLFGNDY